MRERLVLCVAFFMALAGAAVAEDWRPAPDGSLYDKDFLRQDEKSGMLVVRFATGGRAGAPYASWPKAKSPVMLYALDCDADKYLDLGLDFDGSHGLPKNWRNTEKQDDIKLGVGPVGPLACGMKDTAPKVALP